MVGKVGKVGEVRRIGQGVYWARLADARALVLDFYQGERKALGSGRYRWLLAGGIALLAVEASVLALLVRRY
jgi:hypothetical protein